MNKKLLNGLVAFFLFINPALADQSVKCGTEWINLHQNNLDLLGVVVQQYPDNSYDKTFYENTHPAMVIYIFKNNKAHQVSYSPTGQVQSGFWWDIKDKDSIYERMTKDFKEDISCAYYLDNQ
jgi:hypothetical protein